LDNTVSPYFPREWDLVKQWRKPLELIYYKCENYWTMTGKVLSDNPEKEVFIDNLKTDPYLNEKGFSMFVLS